MSRYAEEVVVSQQWNVFETPIAGFFQADQICYAVLCVFSYFAAGQEQKKSILEQATRVPPVSPGRVSPAVRSPQVTSNTIYLFQTI